MNNYFHTLVHTSQFETLQEISERDGYGWKNAWKDHDWPGDYCTDKNHSVVVYFLSSGSVKTVTGWDDSDCWDAPTDEYSKFVPFAFILDHGLPHKKVDKMITVGVKEYSESTILAALKEHFENE